MNTLIDDTLIKAYDETAIDQATEIQESFMSPGYVIAYPKVKKVTERAWEMDGENVLKLFPKAIPSCKPARWGTINTWAEKEIVILFALPISFEQYVHQSFWTKESKENPSVLAIALFNGNKAAWQLTRGYGKPVIKLPTKKHGSWVTILNAAEKWQFQVLEKLKFL